MTLNVLTQTIEDFKNQNGNFDNLIDQIYFALGDSGESRKVQADYIIDFETALGFFSSNKFKERVYGTAHPDTISNIVLKFLLMTRLTSQEAEIIFNIIKSLKQGTKYLLTGYTNTTQFNENLRITNNKEIIQKICQFLVRPENNETFGEEMYTLRAFILKVFGYSELTKEIKDFLYNTFLKGNLVSPIGTSNVHDVFSFESFLYPLAEEYGEKENLFSVLTDGKSYVFNQDAQITTAFPSKEAVFELIDYVQNSSIEVITQYEGKFALPDDEILTDEDIEKYSKFLNSGYIIGNMTWEQVKDSDMFNANQKIMHKDFNLDKINDLSDYSYVPLDKIMNMRNYSQGILIRNANHLKFNTLVSSYQIISEELWNSLQDHGDYENYSDFKKFRDTNIEYLLEMSVRRKDFSFEYIKDVQKYYNVSIGTIFSIIIDGNLSTAYMDDKVKSSLEAMKKLYS